MSDIQKISVALTSEMAALVHDPVQLQNIEEVRHLWQEGIESGTGKYTDIEPIKQEACRRLNNIL